MKTIENNKKIAEFMQLEKHNSYEHLWHNQLIVNANDLRYHCDWNWLMEVVEKIEYNGKYTLNGVYDNRNEFKGWYPEIFTLFPKDEIKDLTDLRFDTKIQAVYKAVMSFIYWRNENKNKK